MADPTAVILQAAKSVKFARNLVVVGAVVAVVALVRTWNIATEVAVYGSVVVLVLATTAMVLSNAAPKRLTNPDTRGAWLVLVYSSAVLVVATSFFLFTSAFFGWPLELRIRSSVGHPGELPLPPREKTVKSQPPVEPLKRPIAAPVPVAAKEPAVLGPAKSVPPPSLRLQLLQFELYGIESAYVKSFEGFGGTGDPILTYAIDPYYKSETSGLAPLPIFNVTLENTSTKPVVLTKILYRVKRIGEVRGGSYGPIEPNVKYRHSLKWTTGEQVAPLVPPFRIDPQSAGSFLLELSSATEGVGLAWLLDIGFQEGDGQVVRGEPFQLIMSKFGA